jgi:hypothetical protein
MTKICLIVLVLARHTSLHMHRQTAFLKWLFRIQGTQLYENFTDRSTDFRNLSVAVGNAERRKKMDIVYDGLGSYCYQNPFLFWWILCCRGETMNILQSFLFALHHQERHYLRNCLNSQKKQEVSCDKRAMGCKRRASVHRE